MTTGNPNSFAALSARLSEPGGYFDSERAEVVVETNTETPEQSAAKIIATHATAATRRNERQLLFK